MSPFVWYMVVCWLAVLRPDENSSSSNEVSINHRSDRPYVELDQEAIIGP